MKKTVFAIAALLLSAGIYSFAPKNYVDVLKVDVVKSKVEWNGSAADHYHGGTVAIKSGEVWVDGGKITGGKFTFDVTTIKTTENIDRLEGHLKSPDFFDVAKFGEATYEITSVKYTSDNAADVEGKLTLKGASVPVKLTAKIRSLKDGKLFTESTFSLDPGPLAFKVAGIDIHVHLFAAK